MAAYILDGHVLKMHVKMYIELVHNDNGVEDFSLWNSGTDLIIFVAGR